MAGLPEWISLGLLARSVPREDVDAAVAACGRRAKRAGGKLPPHVMVYFAMALALFPDDDYGVDGPAGHPAHPAPAGGQILEVAGAAVARGRTVDADQQLRPQRQRELPQGCGQNALVAGDAAGRRCRAAAAWRRTRGCWPPTPPAACGRSCP
ncbi:transposase domain-containing protein [Streptomyces sp. NPDC096030]|uniref:transposase domain-containing protein n=1 Tax=Streptomyces sp. NPDC096030 TaxID=3155423 RepID=UPI00332245C7